MNEYILKNTKTIVLADMYMPNPIAILNEMKPIYKGHFTFSKTAIFG